MRHLSRLLSLIIAAAVTLWSLAALLPRYDSDALDIWMLDVGQGESVFVHEPGGKTLLFDGGPDDSVLTQLGAVMPPWDRRIDLVILSHDHADHVDGLISVLQRFQVGELWISGATYDTSDFATFLHEAQDDRIPTVHQHFHPDPISFGRANLQVYHPPTDMTGQDPAEAHDATLSVKVSYGESSLFLTGDLNEGHERDMLNQCQAPCSLAATVLQVPHHGSGSGLLPEFLAAVHPQNTLIPVGAHNRYHHPAPSTVDKLKAAGIPTYRTDQNGRIKVILPSHGPPRITPQRQAAT